MTTKRCLETKEESVKRKAADKSAKKGSRASQNEQKSSHTKQINTLAMKARNVPFNSTKYKNVSAEC